MSVRISCTIILILTYTHLHNYLVFNYCANSGNENHTGNANVCTNLENSNLYYLFAIFCIVLTL